MACRLSLPHIMYWWGERKKKTKIWWAERANPNDGLHVFFWFLASHLSQWSKFLKGADHCPLSFAIQFTMGAPRRSASRISQRRVALILNSDRQKQKEERERRETAKRKRKRIKVCDKLRWQGNKTEQPLTESSRQLYSGPSANFDGAIDYPFR